MEAIRGHVIKCKQMDYECTKMGNMRPDKYNMSTTIGGIINMVWLTTT